MQESVHVYAGYWVKHDYMLLHAIIFEVKNMVFPQEDPWLAIILSVRDILVNNFGNNLFENSQILEILGHIQP